jgi:hypothetical protein
LTIPTLTPSSFLAMEIGSFKIGVLREHDRDLAVLAKGVK